MSGCCFSCNLLSFYTFTVSLTQSSFLLVYVSRALKEVKSSSSKMHDLLDSKCLPEPT